mmetsp:Transcript_34675/g.50796  ORF Transcript_34675/g.50796 Transcript_34675/m.50796 type:complete len:106 (+) Transcript_34675:86-403(+)
MEMHHPPNYTKEGIHSIMIQIIQYLTCLNDHQDEYNTIIRNNNDNNNGILVALSFGSLDRMLIPYVQDALKALQGTKVVVSWGGGGGGGRTTTTNKNMASNLTIL